VNGTESEVITAAKIKPHRSLKQVLGRLAKLGLTVRSAPGSQSNDRNFIGRTRRIQARMRGQR